MAKYLSAIRNTVRQVLNDELVIGTAEDWKNDEIDVHIRLCLQEVSEMSPYVFREVLTTIANSRVLDISSITDLIEISKLEYPTGYSPRKYRNFAELDAETIEIDTTLVPIAGGSGTLTGTVTFTKGSAAITGSGTDFDGELEVGYHIKKSSGTRWYRIYSITSDTVLTLAEPCLETTGADTVDVSEYCYETVYLYCNKVHTLTGSSSTLSPSLEKLLIDGSTAQVALAWINTVRTQAAAAITKIASVSEAIGNMSAEVEQAIDDLDSGRDYINTISHGGRPERDYADYARTGLANANSYLGQSQGYLRELSARLSIAGLINTYQIWANNKLAMYHADLKRLSTFRTYRTYPKS